MSTIPIFGILIICVIGAATLMSGCIEQSEIPQVESSETHESIIIPTTAPTKIVDKQVGTYENPIPLGSMLISDTKRLNIGIGSIFRGENVNAMIARENMFNDPPKNGYEYMLIVVGVKYNNVGNNVNDKFSLMSYDFRIYADGVECNKPCVVLPDTIDVHVSINMMPDSGSAVTILSEVPIDKTVIMEYDQLFTSSAYYFDCGNGPYEK